MLQTNIYFPPEITVLHLWIHAVTFLLRIASHLIAGHLQYEETSSIKPDCDMALKKIQQVLFFFPQHPVWVPYTFSMHTVLTFNNCYMQVLIYFYFFVDNASSKRLVRRGDGEDEQAGLGRCGSVLSGFQLSWEYKYGKRGKEVPPEGPPEGTAHWGCSWTTPRGLQVTMSRITFQFFRTWQVYSTSDTISPTRDWTWTTGLLYHPSGGMVLLLFNPPPPGPCSSWTQVFYGIMTWSD